MTQPSFNAPAADPQADAPVTPPATSAAPATAPAVVYNGKAFTPEELANKLAHQDQFIEQLKTERQADRDLLAQATAALQQAVTARELLAQPPAAPVTPPAASAPVVDVGAEVDRALTQREAQRVQEQNWREAVTAMTAAFGDQADAKAKEVAASIGYSFEEVVVLAKTKPAAFKRLFPELSAAPKQAVAPASQAGRLASTPTPPPAANGKSGFWGGTHRDSVNAYLEKLKALS